MKPRLRRSGQARRSAPRGPTDEHALERLAHLRGALRLLATAIDVGVRTVEEVHREIARAPLAALAVVPEVRPLGALHEGVRRSVYACIRGVSRALFRGVDVALERAGPALAPPAAIPGPLVGVLHGVLGDAMARDANPMHTAMSLRRGGRSLALTREALAAALPRAGDRVVVFVHGLACDESSWQICAPAWAEHDAPETDRSYGALLHARHGYTDLYLRYNSGLRIADNGAALSAVLRELVAAYPVPLRELVLVGHSMGGLVVRSACRHGRAADEPWTAALRRVLCLGSPHRGAPLEKLGVGVVATLAAVPVTAPIARLLDGRSVGIKDLGRGLECEPESADVHLLAASLGAAAPWARALGWLVGDGLVRVASATDERLVGAARVHFPGLHHMHLLGHPAVYAHIESLLGAPKAPVA